MSVVRVATEKELVLRGKRRWWIVPTVLIGFAIWDSWTDVLEGEADWEAYFAIPCLVVMVVAFLILVRTLRVQLSPTGIRLQWYVGIKAFPVYAMDWAVPWSCFYSIERFDFLKWLDIPPRGVLLYGRKDGRSVLVSLSTLTTDFGEALAFAIRHVDPEIVTPEALELAERYR